MTCGEIQEQLSAWLDGELPEELKNLVAAHLQGCARCRRELAALERLSAAFQLLVVEPPRDLVPLVRRRLRRPLVAWAHNLALAACLVVGLFVGGTLTGTLYPGSGALSPPENDWVSLEILQDYPSGSVAGTFFYAGEEENGL